MWKLLGTSETADCFGWISILQVIRRCSDAQRKVLHVAHGLMLCLASEFQSLNSRLTLSGRFGDALECTLSSLSSMKKIRNLFQSTALYGALLEQVQIRFLAVRRQGRRTRKGAFSLSRLNYATKEFPFEMLTFLICFIDTLRFIYHHLCARWQAERILLQNFTF